MYRLKPIYFHLFSLIYLNYIYFMIWRISINKKIFELHFFQMQISEYEHHWNISHQWPIKSWQRKHCAYKSSFSKRPFQIFECSRYFKFKMYGARNINSRMNVCLYIRYNVLLNSCFVDMSVIQIIQLAVGTNF